MLSRFSKKELVISGCSMIADYVSYRNKLHKTNKFYKQTISREEYTTLEWKQQIPFPTLDILIAKRFNLSPINLGAPGAGNKQIFDITIEYLIKHSKKIKLLIVCWSNLTRYDIKTNIWNDYYRYYRTYFYDSYFSDQIKQEHVYKKEPMLRHLFELGAIDPKIDVEVFLKNSYIISKICDSLGVECVQCATISSPFFQYNSNIFLENKFISDIDGFHFYGWPIYTNIGGEQLFIMNKSNILNEIDNHPNELGHKEMAHKLIKFIEERQILA